MRIFRVLSKIPPRPRFQSKQYNKSSRYQNKPEGMLAGEDTTKLIPNISLIYRLLILPSLPFPQGDLTGIIVYLCLSLQALQVYWSSSSACVVSFNSSQCLDAAATFLCSFLIQFKVFSWVVVHHLADRLSSFIAHKGRQIDPWLSLIHSLMVVLWTEKETKREVRYEWTKYFQFSQISSQSWVKCLKKTKNFGVKIIIKMLKAQN